MLAIRSRPPTCNTPLSSIKGSNLYNWLLLLRLICGFRALASFSASTRCYTAWSIWSSASWSSCTFICVSLLEFPSVDGASLARIKFISVHLYFKQFATARFARDHLENLWSLVTSKRVCVSSVSVAKTCFLFTSESSSRSIVVSSGRNTSWFHKNWGPLNQFSAARRVFTLNPLDAMSAGLSLEDT